MNVLIEKMSFQQIITNIENIEENDAKNCLIMNHLQLLKRSEITHALKLLLLCRKCWIVF